MNRKHVKYIFVLSFIIAAVTFINAIPNSSNIIAPFDIKKRPISLVSKKYVYDWANILTSVDEYRKNSLCEDIIKKYGIEVVIVTLPNLQGHASVEDVARKLFDNWQIGKKYNNKGILLLFVKNPKVVKVKITKSLKDTFADKFIGHIQNFHLKPNYLGGTPNKGIVAAFEEVEKRLQTKTKKRKKQNEVKLKKY